MEGKSRSNFGRYGDSACPTFWELLEPFTRVWGVATSVVMCGVGVEMTVYHHPAGIYILIGSIVVFFLEIMWVITLFIELCTNQNEYTLALRCWDAVACRAGWRRCPAYAAGALCLALWPRWLWLARAAGGMLLALAALHAALALAAPPRRALLPDQHHHLVADTSDCGTDRYDDLTEVMDDSFPAAINNSNTNRNNATVSPTVKEQDAIIEI